MNHGEFVYSCLSIFEMISDQWCHFSGVYINFNQWDYVGVQYSHSALVSKMANWLIICSQHFMICFYISISHYILKRTQRITIYIYFYYCSLIFFQTKRFAEGFFTHDYPKPECLSCYEPRCVNHNWFKYDKQINIVFDFLLFNGLG